VKKITNKAKSPLIKRADEGALLHRPHHFTIGVAVARVGL